MATHSTDSVELRGMCPRDTINILDAWSCARGISRMDLVNEILAEKCVQKVHEANVIYRAARGNPQPADASAN